MIWLGAFFQGLTLGHTSHPLSGLRVPFWIHLGVLNLPQNGIKNYFRIVLDFFSYKNGPIDLVRGLFLSLDIATYISTTCRPL